MTMTDDAKQVEPDFDDCRDLQHGWTPENDKGFDRGSMSGATDVDARRMANNWNGYFGLCPRCAPPDSVLEELNIEMSNWIVCHEHRVYWRIGSNVFTGWHHETRNVWQRNEELLETYQEVRPVRPESETEQSGELEEFKRTRERLRRWREQEAGAR